MRRSLQVLSAAAVLAIGSYASAGVSVPGFTYAENFDTLPSTGTSTLAGTAVVGVQATLPGGTGWEGVRAGGTGTTDITFVANPGSGTAGALYSYGSTGSGERALGALASGTVIAAFGVELVNNSGLDWTDFTLSFTAEFWRSSTSAQNYLTFAYGVSGGGLTSANYLTDAAMAAWAPLDVVGPLPVATNGALDGNLPANQALVSSTVNVFVPAGSSLFIRWTDFNDAGNDAGLAIDQVGMTFTAVPEPTSLAILGLGALGLMARRRRA